MCGRIYLLKIFFPAKMEYMQPKDRGQEQGLNHTWYCLALNYGSLTASVRIQEKAINS